MAVFLLLISIIVGGCNEMSNKTITYTKKFPEKPITMIVGFPAGGGSDLLARSLEKVSIKHLGQPLMIVNKPGGSGTIGLNELVRSNPDGYVLSITTPEAIVMPLYGQAKYQYVSALDPIAQISNASIAMVIQADTPWQNVDELIQYAKQHPGELKFGHSGIGSVTHIIGERFIREADINIQQVPFRGGPEVVIALLGKHIQIGFVPIMAIKEQVLSGALRILAVASERRISDPKMDQIPTFKEQGLDIAFNYRYGIAAPKDLPPEVKTKLSEGFKSMILDPDFKKDMDALGLEIEYLGPKETQEQWLADNTKLAKTIQETGILDRIKEQKN